MTSSTRISYHKNSVARPLILAVSTDIEYLSWKLLPTSGQMIQPVELSAIVMLCVKGREVGNTLLQLRAIHSRQVVQCCNIFALFTSTGSWNSVPERPVNGHDPCVSTMTDVSTALVS